MWDFDEDPPPPPRRRRGRGGGGDYAEPATAAAAAATSLMEAEEYGEMMESVDEANFALDGLRATAPRRVRRASFLALLGICASAPRRRVLRAQGLVQQIIDAILVLNIDDPPCTIGAAALLFVLASDVQENHLLDSESCVHFLLKLLNPPVNLVDSKAPSIGSKLLGISKVQMLNGSSKDSDCISEEILSKVEEILLSCQEIKSLDKDDKKTTRPELCPKWLALLTMEKACLSAVSVEETSDTVSRVGGNFKETLRELGGLDSIFDVMMDCHSTLENLIKDTSTSALDLNEGTSLQSAALLLKCLKILENATFLSDDNKNSSVVSSSTYPKSSKVSQQSCSAHVMGGTSFNDGKRKNSKKKNLLSNQTRHSCLSSKSEVSHITISSGSDAGLSQKAFNCSPSISSNGASSGSLGERHSNGSALKLNIKKDRGNANPIRGSSGWISIRAHSSDGNSREMAKRRRLSENVITDSGGGDDPFAFDDVDQEPSNWELLGPKKKSPQKHQDKSGNGVLVASHEPDQPEDLNQSGTTSLFSAKDESSLLEDCLLASVKVLMNLANDNPSGCELIASCGGLNTMASLIMKHFPSFCFVVDNNYNTRDGASSCRDVNLDHELSSSQNSKAHQVKIKQLRDHELDFLVAILGLLVNLVEKDSLNRVRLSSARVPVDLSQNPQSEETQRDVIALLCSVFLASQGASEASGTISPDDEESLMQGAREAEMMIVEAYAALLLAFLSTESMKVRGAISSCLPNNSLKILVPALEKFVSFHLQLNMITEETHSAVTEVIEKCKLS
uniref:Wings apart-like protein C-terminal domain-containing protein n=1 Tax=Oryza barthii TaxID=65489 RepID=A0A0D3HF68_9ORYZ